MMMRRTCIRVCAAAIGLFCMAPAQAGVLSTSTDEIFIAKATQSGLAEVAAGSVAQTNGASDAIRAFGLRMVHDHRKMGTQLALIARADHVSYPLVLKSDDRAGVAKMKQLSGSDFDAAYVNAQLAAHDAAIDLFTVEVAQGSYPQLVAFAKKQLPALEQHRSMLKAILIGM